MVLSKLFSVSVYKHTSCVWLTEGMDPNEKETSFSAHKEVTYLFYSFHTTFYYKYFIVFFVICF